jgi:hypothetical protein
MSNPRNRALRLLTENPDGCAVDTLVAHGFPLELLMELIVAGLATTQTEQVGRASHISRSVGRVLGSPRRDGVRFNDNCPPAQPRARRHTAPTAAWGRVADSLDEAKAAFRAAGAAHGAARSIMRPARLKGR